ncbi:hypothetical protein NL676_002462 [Syzygium grande]|nr:hypothetical protein NL676_002462 [Syzygium grande]
MGMLLRLARFLGAWTPPSETERDAAVKRRYEVEYAVQISTAYSRRECRWVQCMGLDLARDSDRSVLDGFQGTGQVTGS